jgi:transglutaminase-like putative cysteine protease
MRCLAVLVAMLAAWIGAFLPAHTEETGKARLDPQLPYQAAKSNPVSYDVDFTVVVTAPYHTRLFKVWLPMPQSDAGQEVTEGSISTSPMEVKPRIETERAFGNTFAYFEFDHPEGAQIIRHTFRIKVWELNWNVDPAKVERVAEWPSGFQPYLRSDRSVTVDDRFRNLAREIVPERHGPARDLAEVMAWVNQTMTYDHAQASLQASSEHALEFHRGHCSYYHGFCAAVGRAMNYPTRVTYGLNTFPKNSPSHCKLEAFLPAYGWVSFDVSETQRLIGDIQKSPDLAEGKKAALIQAAKDRLAHGFRDNTWFVQTRGTDYDLAPPAKERVKVVRTIHAEADGVALPDPDPANPSKREFAWMTAQQFKADRAVTYPFKDWQTLLKK